MASFLRSPPFKPCVTFGRMLYTRIDKDGLTMLAGHLAYVSLLSLVPLITVIFALFAAFPMFADISIKIESLHICQFLCQLPATLSKTIWSSLSRTQTG